MFKILVLCALFISFVLGAPLEDVQVIKYTNDQNANGYKYEYELANGQRVEEEGYYNANNILVVRGSYSYIGPDGIMYTVTYISDENGFQPTGDHLPTNGLPPSDGLPQEIFGAPPNAVLSLLG